MPFRSSSTRPLCKLIVAANLDRVCAFAARDPGEPPAVLEEECLRCGQDEDERGKILFLALRIDALATRYGCELLNLAIPNGINNRVVAALAPDVRERLTINIKEDLTSSGIDEINTRFLRRHL